MLTIFRTIFAPPKHLIPLVIAAWIGLALAEIRTERHGIGKNDLNNLTFYGVSAFLIGGRITFVLQNIPAFTKSPLDIFSINPDLFDPFGALAVALITGFVYGQRKNLLFWSVLDALTPLFAILAAGFGLSHLAAGTAFGIPADIPWGIYLWNATRHPTQIYETFAALLILILLWLKRHNPHAGMLFLTFTSLTAASQLFNQAFRGDSTLILKGLKQEQVFAWIVLAISFGLFELRFNAIKSGRRPADRRQKRAPDTKE